MDGIKFPAPALVEAASQMLIKDFAGLMQDRRRQQQLLEVPASIFLALIKDSALESSQDDVIELLKDYLLFREGLPERPSELAEKPESGEAGELDLEVSALKRLQNYKLSEEEKQKLIDALKVDRISHKKLVLMSSESVFLPFQKVFL